MADFAATVLQNARAWLTDTKQAFEFKTDRWNAIRAMLAFREYTFPELNDLRTSSKRATQAMYLKKQSFTLGTSHSCDPTGERGDSALQTLTWSKKTGAVDLPTKPFNNNEVSRERALAVYMRELERNILDATETAVITFLEANKTTVNAASSDGHNTWFPAGSIMQVSLADLPRFYNYAKAELEMNFHYGNTQSIHNTIWDAEIMNYTNQGGGNSTNTAYQFPGFEMYPTNAISPSGYYNHFQYLVPDGGISMIDWVDPTNIRGDIKDARKWTTWESLFFPGQLRFQLFIKEGCVDSTSYGGDTQDPADIFEMGLTYSLNYAQQTTGTPIYKYGVRTT
jgi:hypothetical protein